MNPPTDAQRLRIVVGESDKHGHRPLYETLIEEAHRRGLAGATVTRGIMGYGKSSRIHTAKILQLSEDLPTVIEIVDRPETIQAFLPTLAEILEGRGLVTLEHVQVLRQDPGSAPGV